MAEQFGIISGTKSEDTDFDLYIDLGDGRGYMKQDHTAMWIANTIYKKLKGKAVLPQSGTPRGIALFVNGILACSIETGGSDNWTITPNNDEFVFEFNENSDIRNTFFSSQFLFEVKNVGDLGVNEN